MVGYLSALLVAGAVAPFYWLPNQSGRVGLTCFRDINKHYYALLEGISQFLPDMNLTINLYDSPLVFTSLEDRERLIAIGKSGKCESSDPRFFLL
jgi:hypothetical protein